MDKVENLNWRATEFKCEIGYIRYSRGNWYGYVDTDIDEIELGPYDEISIVMVAVESRYKEINGGES